MRNHTYLTYTYGFAAEVCNEAIPHVFRLDAWHPCDRVVVKFGYSISGNYPTIIIAKNDFMPSSALFTMSTSGVANGADFANSETLSDSNAVVFNFPSRMLNSDFSFRLDGINADDTITGKVTLLIEMSGPSN